MEHISILGISGSLSTDSTNTIILNTCKTLLPENVTLTVFHGLDQIPHFSPGLKDNEAVTWFKSAVAQADAVIFSTPEYAFGVPGTLKNALDWTVATGEFNAKPVAAISASPLNTGGEKALSSLLLTLTALGTLRNEHSAAAIPNIKSKIEQGYVTELQTLQILRAQIDNLLNLLNLPAVN
ncbi:NADPH-dependent FMN reductase [Dyadobacter crusticola]|uniref:NADPH-dependent FMN reductase n=1 Tax=Dyadobacter crusticola TaxID=292407 RepID=UPI000550A479|nr:NADPH-dependent FMN reductase [Dyadobacter crusticola]